MPRKAGKRSYKRRFVRRAKKHTKATTLVNKSGLSPIPSRYITKMKYASATVLTGIGMKSWQLNLNSLYDPDRTFTGHQPYGYDSLLGTAQGGGLYNRYRVISCRYVITVANDTYNIHYAVLPSNDATPPISNVSEARENPRCQYAVQNPGGTLKKISGNVYIPALMGRSKTQYMADDTYGGTWNTTPSEIAILNIYAQGLNDDAGVSMTHTVNVLLEYTAELYDPNNLDQS